MPDVAVKKASEQQTEEKTADQRKEGALSRPTIWDREVSSWFSPAEFFANPFALMRRFNEEFDRAFGRSTTREFARDTFWTPPIELAENNGQLKVHAELPGLKPR